MHAPSGDDEAPQGPRARPGGSPGTPLESCETSFPASWALVDGVRHADVPQSDSINRFARIAMKPPYMPPPIDIEGLATESAVMDQDGDRLVQRAAELTS